MLTPEYVVNETISAILINQEVLCLPASVYLLVMLKAILPPKAFYYGHKAIGAASTMRTFVGREAQPNDQPDLQHHQQPPPQHQPMLSPTYGEKQTNLPSHSIGITIEPNKQMGTETV